MSGSSSTGTPVITLPAEGHRGVDSFSVACIHDATSFSQLLDVFGKVEAEHRQQGRCFLTLDTVDLGERDVPALIADLQELYGHHESAGWADLATVVESSRVLLLGYTEDFAETTVPPGDE